MPRITRAEDLFWPTPGHPVETIANLDAIPIQECGEPMVDLAVACPAVDLRPRGGIGSTGKPTLWVRSSVADRLGAAQARLTTLRPELRLVILDGWRPPGRQMVAHHIARFVFRLRYPFLPAALIREAANKYVATPDSIAPPPHSTGGAIDLRIVYVESGKNLPMAGPPRTEHDAVQGADRENRALLSTVMNDAGFSNYEEEWWHWSYGDSGWALRANHATAIYGRVTRPAPAAKV